MQITQETKTLSLRLGLYQLEYISSPITNSYSSLLLCFCIDYHILLALLCVYKHGWFYLENAKIDEVASLAIKGILDLVGTQQSEALDVHSIQELHYHLTAMIQ